MASRSLAVAFLVAAVSPSQGAETTLNMKLVSFYLSEKDGMRHLVGATILPDGTAGPEDYFVRPKDNGLLEGSGVFDLENGNSIKTIFQLSNPDKAHGKGASVITGKQADDCAVEARETKTVSDNGRKGGPILNNKKSEILPQYLRLMGFCNPKSLPGMYRAYSSG